MASRLLIPLVLAAVMAFTAIALFGTNNHATYAATSIDPEEQSFMNLLNAYRADPDGNPNTNDGMPPLAIDTSMTNASEWMSTDLGENAYFDHTDSTGRDPWQRLCDFGYCYNTWKGENIAAGYETGAAVFQGWKNSPGHNANMLGTHYTVMGLARVYVQGSPYGYYWTNDFGGYTVPGSSPPPAPTSTPTPTPTHVATPTHTPSPTASPTKTPSPTPTPTATPTATPEATQQPTDAPTAAPTASPTPAPTAAPTPSPTPDPVMLFADVDCDDHLTGLDVARILGYAAGVDSPYIGGCPPVGSKSLGVSSGGSRYHGDLNCSGKVDALDALAELKALTGDYSLIGCP